MRVRDASEGFGATVGEPVDARITIGDVTLSRSAGGWTVDADDVDLAQLDAAVQLAKHVPAAAVVKPEAVLSIVGEDGDSGSALSDARDLFQEHAETNGGEDAGFGGPDVEFGVGPADYGDPIYGVHVLAEAKLKELAQSDVLKVPIKMLEIGNEYVPDKTFNGVTKEWLAGWKQDVWPIWKLQEDGFIKLSPSGVSAKITRRGQTLLKQIKAGLDCVYGHDDALYPPQGDHTWRGLDDGAGVPMEWRGAVVSSGIGSVILANGDPKAVADGLLAVAQSLKLDDEDDIVALVDWACRDYARADEVAEDIEKRLDTPVPPI